MVTSGNKIQQNTIKSYRCIECCFITQHKGNYNEHLLTAKHKRVTMGNIKPTDNFVCDCGNKYKNVK